MHAFAGYYYYSKLYVSQILTVCKLGLSYMA